MAPKKNVKMDLSTFLSDDTFGTQTDSWADEFDPSMLQNTNSTIDIGFNLPTQEPEIPEDGPFTARISAFPDYCTEDDLRNFFIDGLHLANPDQFIEDFRCPRERDGSLKNFAFITFATKELLLEALELNDKPIHNKPVYVSVAKPSKNAREPRGSRYGSRFGDEDLDWGARGSMSAQPRRRREDIDLDWGSARSGMSQPSMERREFRGPPRERAPREENLDWSARGTLQQNEPERREFRGPPRERAPREENLDWGARGTLQQNEPERREYRAPRKERAPKEDDLDWSALRGSKLQQQPVRRSFKPKTDDFEWGARGSMLKEQEKKRSSQPEKKETPVDGPKKSIYSVLANEDSDEEDEEEGEKQQQQKEAKDSSEEITQATSNLHIGDEAGWTRI